MSTRGALELVDVGKRYEGGVTALDAISLRVERGSFVSIVGASGSGKSTLLSLIAGLSAPTSGVVLLDGHPVTGAGPDRGLIFQQGAVYPFRTVERNIAFGLELLPRLSRAERRARVDWYLAETGLTALRKALPKQLSGGQRQRVAIARALAAEPTVLILDESVAALDVSIQAQVLNLLADIRDETAVSYILISHDLAVVRQLTDEAIVLHRGEVVERGRTAQILDDPQHAYTRRLRASVPRPGWKPVRRA